MKKMAIACALLSSVVASSVWADAASSLKSRLDKVSSFMPPLLKKSPMAAVPRCRRDRVIYGLSGQIYSTGI